jgi:potassium voltage-gated channel Eag-related subfamily H protein 7
MTMIKFALMTVFLVHFMACIWSQVAIGWEFIPEEDLESDTTWIVAGNYSGWVEDRPMRVYSIAFYTAVVAMFGGVGSIIPHNHTEFVAMTCMMILGSFVWAWVIGSLCGILATLDPQATAFRNTMDELNYFMADSNFPNAHKVRLREFFRHRKDFDRIVAYETLLSKMSSQLKGDSALLLSIETIRPVWYLHDDHCEKEFLAITALHMHHAVYESHEQMPIEDLTVLIKGMVAQSLKITSKGGVFGEECIIPEQHSGLRTDLYISCVSFVMVVVISRETLFELVENFPNARKWLDRCSKILTLRAAFRKAYAIHRKEKKIKTRSSEWMKPQIAPAVEPSKWKQAMVGLKAARRRQLSTTKNLFAQPVRESPNNSNGGAAIFADVMYQQGRSNPLPNHLAPQPRHPSFSGTRRRRLRLPAAQ